MRKRGLVFFSIIMIAIGLMTGCGSRKTEAEAVYPESIVISEESSIEEKETVTVSEEEIEEASVEETVAETEVTDHNIATMYESFEIISSNLNGGKWDDIISKTKGDNVSPQLSWEVVEGAELYVIYMVDIDAHNFMHWKADGITVTELEQGWAASDYVGPYPPAGSTHTYDIYVFALKKPVERLKGSVDGMNLKYADFIEEIDTDIDGNTGNVIACGYLSGIFTN